MKKTKIHSQSSQQTTLTSFFKVNPTKICSKFSNSQSSADSGHSSDTSPFKALPLSNKMPEKRRENLLDKNSYKNKYKTDFHNKFTSTSPKKQKNFGSTNVKQGKNDLSPSKSSLVSFIKKLSPVKSPLKVVEENNILLPVRARGLNKSTLSDTEAIEIIDLSNESSSNFDNTISNKLNLRRSPRKHPSSSPDFSLKAKLKQSRSNNNQSIDSFPTILIDEPDDGRINDVELMNDKYETIKKRSLSDLENTDARVVKKSRIQSLEVSAKEIKSPIKLKDVDCFINDDLFSSDDLSFFSDSSDFKSPGNVDLSNGCRCKVSEVKNTPEGDLLLILKCLITDAKTPCILQYPWSNLPVKEGDHVSVKACKSDTSDWQVSERNGTWFVIHSDVLISCTNVVGSLFCSRRSVLNNLFKEIPSSSQASAMYVGIIVHNLLQQALKNKLHKKDQIEKLYEDVIRSQEFLKMIFLQGIELEKIKETTSTYLPKIVEFIHNYVSINGKCMGSNPREWPGEITNINDIEENIWVPQLGLKGKIDATIQVKIHSKTKVMPLELKTGKPSNSAEHRGQVILYCMMLNLIGEQSADSGLLLYLKDGSLKEVQGGDVEKRHLIMLRNELASRIQLAYSTSEVDGIPSLPSPIDRQSVCKNCPQLINCTAVLRKSGDSSHPLSALVPETTSHLSDEHLDYVFSWLRMVSLESNQAKQFSPIWANSVDIRENEGSCISDLTIKGKVNVSNFKVEITLSRDKPIQKGILEEGQYVIVSNDKQVAIATGHVQSVSSSQVSLVIDRDLSKLTPPFHIDRYESNASKGFLTNFLSILLDNSTKADRLRRIIIDKELPKFAPKLSSKIKLIGQKIFASINRNQVRAILQVLSADSFIIIKGMPGTGKSRTVSALIELLTLLGHSILLTSHTHSAVDNILVKLPKNLHDKVIRLGKSNRVNPSISHLTESSLLSANPDMTFDELASLYNSKTIVGVTCLGALHHLIVQREFDYCIVDEATQVSQPETIAALSASKKFVLIGDPNQLPPLVISEKAKELGMGISLLERLDRAAVTTSLTAQYRMNQTITSLVNSITYNGLLKCADDKVASATIQHCNKHEENTPDWLIKVCCSKLSSSVTVINVSTTDQANQNVNEKEASIINSVVSTLKKIGISASDIGVMSPYRAQVSLIEKELKNVYSGVEVSTVDQYQGRDKSVIFYSASRNKEMVPGSYDILGDKNRFTVAITRAKHKLIIVGNVEALSSYPIFKSLFSSLDPSNFICPNGTT